MKYRVIAIGPAGTQPIITKWSRWEPTAYDITSMKFRYPAYNLRLEAREGRFTRRRNLRAWMLRQWRAYCQFWMRVAREPGAWGTLE